MIKQISSGWRNKQIYNWAHLYLCDVMTIDYRDAVKSGIDVIATSTGHGRVEYPRMKWLCVACFKICSDSIFRAATDRCRAIQLFLSTITTFHYSARWLFVYIIWIRHLQFGLNIKHFMCVCFSDNEYCFISVDIFVYFFLRTRIGHDKW